MFLFTFSHNNVKDILSLTYLKHAKLGVFLSIVRERDIESPV